MHYGHHDHCSYVYPYGGYAGCGAGYGHNFALIVVLFILLIIIGACYVK